MPICEADPWRLQYFSHVQTSVNIPTEDPDAWQWYPAYRWVYDKLEIALSQNLDAGPHGTPPPHYPVFSKPIINLKGMGAGSRVLRSAAEYEKFYAPGHMWVTLLEGRHVSSDVAVVNGEPRWWRHVTGKPAGEGPFDYWWVHAEPDSDIEANCGEWVRRHLAGYTGMLNLETIGGSIIEAHLRFADQWPDLYGDGWIDALVKLYEKGIWEFSIRIGVMDIASSCSAPMAAIMCIPASVIDEVGRMDSVTSVQVTFHEDWSPERHSMPPRAGFALPSLTNCFESGARGGSPRAGLSSFFYLMRRMARVSGTAKHTGRRPAAKSR